MTTSTGTSNNLYGYWGKPTASVDWCESNYQHSHYIAETFNTISNLWYIISALLFLWHTRSFYRKMFGVGFKYGKGPLQGLATNNNFIHEPLLRFPIIGLSVAMVGVGSWMFHMTLQVRDQMWDELSMHLPILSLLYSLWNHREYVNYHHGQRVLMNMFLSKDHLLSFMASVSLFILLLSIYNVHTPLLFIGTFFFEMIFSYHFSMQVANSSGGKSNTCEHHRAQKKKLIRLVFASFILAFTVWNMDKAFCGVGMIDALKLHSFWHLFTAYGCYLWGTFLMYGYYADKHDYLVSIGKIENDNKGYVINWKAYVLPWIEFDINYDSLKSERA